MAEGMFNPRRHGPVNRIRRALYGMMLMSASLPALAGGHDAPAKAKPGAKSLPQVRVGSRAPRDRDLLLLRDPTLPEGANVVAWDGAEAVLREARAISPDFALVPAAGGLLTAHYLGDTPDLLRGDLGVDLQLPDVGYFHLNLGRAGSGRRWQLGEQGLVLPESENHVWSLGGSLDLEPSGRAGRRALVFVPQLVMNLDSAVPLSGRVQAILSYHRWCASAGDLPPAPGKVPQIALKWAF